MPQEAPAGSKKPKRDREATETSEPTTKSKDKKEGIRATRTGDPQWMAAVALLYELLQWQMQADVIANSGILSACGKGERWIATVAWLRKMQQWQVQIDVITCNAAMSACDKG